MYCLCTVNCGLCGLIFLLLRIQSKLMCQLKSSFTFRVSVFQRDRYWWNGYIRLFFLSLTLCYLSLFSQSTSLKKYKRWRLQFLQLNQGLLTLFYFNLCRMHRLTSARLQFSFVINWLRISTYIINDLHLKDFSYLVGLKMWKHKRWRILSKLIPVAAELTHLVSFKSLEDA